ncbi:MAG: hypothetical protein A2X56_14775 [Nitrospirae bacterium GWC2_57_13]|nr:MAG: hypothetical protein A2X56_14775 [Nitrospirae bacterium GWC2_57_13]
MTIDDRINRFKKYFENELRMIDAIPASDSSKKFKKALYVSVIDALSKSVFPHRNGKNHERFVAFLMRFANWSEGYRISMPHLAQLLRINPDPAFEKLRKIIFEAYDRSNVHRSQLVGLDTDPTSDEIKKNWPTLKECRIPIEGITLESLQHFHLLYAYRNSLVHELREPGYGIESKDDEDYPYYHGMTIVDAGKEEKSIELVYPVMFFQRLVSTCLNNLEIYLKDNKLDPYAYYKFGTYWIFELNE